MKGKLTRETQADRISELLGLSEDIKDTASLTAQVAKGLSPASAEKILEIMHSQPVLNLVPDRAFRQAKMEGRPLSNSKSQTLYDFARTYEVADRIYYGDGAMVMRFLEKPNPDLGGAAPMAMAISSSKGADAVINLLNELG